MDLIRYLCNHWSHSLLWPVDCCVFDAGVYKILLCQPLFGSYSGTVVNVHTIGVVIPNIATLAVRQYGAGGGPAVAFAVLPVTYSCARQ